MLEALWEGLFANLGFFFSGGGVGIYVSLVFLSYDIIIKLVVKLIFEDFYNEVLRDFYGGSKFYEV